MLSACGWEGLHLPESPPGAPGSLGTSAGAGWGGLLVSSHPSRPCAWDRKQALCGDTEVALSRVMLLGVVESCTLRRKGFPGSRLWRACPCAPTASLPDAS